MISMVATWRSALSLSGARILKARQVPLKPSSSDRRASNFGVIRTVLVFMMPDCVPENTGLATCKIA